MVVYWEYAFAENCLLDGVLCYLAVRTARGRTSRWRLLCASLLGGIEAVLFPLVAFPTWAVYPVKVLGGVLLMLIAERGGGKKLLLATGAFFGYTFALGGSLVALYSFFDVAYVEGEGYLIESAPVSLILVTTVLFTIVSVRGIKFFYRFRRLQQSLCECQITVGERTAHWQGFLDSGNQLSFRGEPVCVISAEGIFALFGKEAKAVGRIAVTTVNSSKERPVFRCDGLTIEGKSVGAVYFTVGDVKNKTVILHTALVEGSYGTVYGTQAALTEDKGGKRRTLSLRK